MRPFPYACWLLLLGIATAHAGGEIKVEASRKGELLEVRAYASIEATLSVIWTTLTDYDRLPEFVPGMRKSKVTSRRGGHVIVEQSGEASFLMFTFPIEVTLEAFERPPSSIHVRAIGGNLRHFEGGYKVESDPAGTAMILRWEGTVIPDISLPPLIGEVVMRMRIEDQFTGMVREIERREATRRKDAQLK